ncbi:MAG: DUF928 domain-containing protein [Leptolyngbyaceae cyanobacterium bins.349]|nr:DUF928 domain-containing protein [Leptolyngbyaceae cyanobacterium bins.349]
MERIMPPQLVWLHQHHKQCWIVLCTLALLLNTPATAIAGYTPPPRPSAPRRGTTTLTGVRGGCGGEVKVPLTALAPVQHVGQTISTHPTVVWFVPDQKPYPIALTLFEATEKGRGTTLYKTELQSTAGIMSFTLPKDQPGLTTGKQYIWQVAVKCDLNRPSKDQWVETLVEVVPIPSDLKTRLAKTNDPLQRSQLYGQSGFWYDALAEAIKTPRANTLRLELLKTLSQLEVAEQQTRLTAIAALLEQRP